MGQYDLYISGAKIIKERYPELWHLSFPRHIVPPNGYANTKVAGASVASELLMSVSMPKHEFNKTMVDTVLIAWKLAELQVPTFFVGQDIIEDLAQSEPPADLILSELNWPHDGMIFMLPERFQRAYFKRVVPFVALAKQPSGKQNPPACVTKVLPASPAIGIEIPGRHAMIFTAPIFFTPDKPVDYAGSWPTDARVGDVIADPMFYDSTNENEIGYLPNSCVPMKEEDIELTNKIFMVGLWLLMLLNSEPQHLQMGVVTCKRKQKSAHEAKGESDLWSPNFIGRAYVRSESQGGTHASPRAHSRRAHWTHQAHGPQRSLRTLKWIKRTMVNVKVEA